MLGSISEGHGGAGKCDSMHVRSTRALRLLCSVRRPHAWPGCAMRKRTVHLQGVKIASAVQDRDSHGYDKGWGIHNNQLAQPLWIV